VRAEGDYELLPPLAGEATVTSAAAIFWKHRRRCQPGNRRPKKNAQRRNNETSLPARQSRAGSAGKMYEDTDFSQGSDRRLPMKTSSIDFQIAKIENHLKTAVFLRPNALPAWHMRGGPRTASSGVVLDLHNHRRYHRKRDSASTFPTPRPAVNESRDSLRPSSSASISEVSSCGGP